VLFPEVQLSEVTLSIINAPCFPSSSGFSPGFFVLFIVHRPLSELYYYSLSKVSPVLVRFCYLCTFFCSSSTLMSLGTARVTSFSTTTISAHLSLLILQLCQLAAFIRLSLPCPCTFCISVCNFSRISGTVHEAVLSSICPSVTRIIIITF